MKTSTRHKTIDGVALKQCYDCKRFKPVGEYGRNSAAKDGLMGKCRPCAKVSRAKYFPPEKRREYNYTYRKSAVGRYKKCKQSALDRGKDWSLALEEFKSFWQKPCAYCGDIVETVGLDRVDNNVGYQVDNLVSCCCFCNVAKNNHSREFFLDKVKKIASRV